MQQLALKTSKTDQVRCFSFSLRSYCESVRSLNNSEVRLDPPKSKWRADYVRRKMFFWENAALGMMLCDGVRVQA